jgi:hypothetical protein
MKIRPDFERAKWRNACLGILIYKGKEHRPPKRVLRDHRKNVATATRRAIENGHRLGKWRYWHGASTAWCQRCGRLVRVRLNEQQPEWTRNLTDSCETEVIDDRCVVKSEEKE